MPELPEVATMVEVLGEHLTGRELPGHGRLCRIWRHGKVAVFDFEQDRLIARLGMTGTFRLMGEPGPHTRAVLPFAGQPLYFDDIRRFGRLCWGPDLPRLGPDALAIAEADFAALLTGRDRKIKALLLDQGVVSGLGNIYCDECLFAARVHPLTPAAAVPARELHRAIAATLLRAIDMRGSTISDFVDPLGRPGRFQAVHQAYGREGKPCPRCGTAIVRVVAAQRGTHYCPACQPVSRPPSQGSRRRVRMPGGPRRLR